MDLTPTDPSSVGSWTGHIVSLFAIGGSFFGLIPALAAILAVIWYSLEIYDNRTVRVWRANWRIRQIGKLKAKLAKLETVRSIPSDPPSAR